MPVETSVGTLNIEAYVGDSALSEPVVTVRSGPVEPDLPSGMSVTASIGVLVSLQPERTLKNVRVKATWQAMPTDGGPTSGEGLDAQEWETGGSIVLLGTEDGEALAYRLKAHGLALDPYPVVYLPLGSEVTLPELSAGSATTLHFTVAVNRFPEPVDCSAWFAADVPHERVQVALGGS